MDSKINPKDSGIDNPEERADFTFLLNAIEGLEYMDPGKKNTKNLSVSIVIISAQFIEILVCSIVETRRLRYRSSRVFFQDAILFCNKRSIPTY